MFNSNRALSISGKRARSSTEPPTTRFFDCSKMTPGNNVVAVPASAPKNYGQYYATRLQLAKAAEQPAVLWILWAHENDQWKIIAYHVLTP
jgi:hypothetical protein